MTLPRDPLRLTPEVCGFLANTLEESVENLESWDVRVADVNRLREAVGRLRATENDGSFPSDTDALRAIGFALRTAHDFRYITSCLPPDRIEVVAKELQQAVSGTLEQSNPDRTGYQFQTQFWIGAVVSFSGHEAVIPSPASRARADFYVQNGLNWYGIEVKRPGSLKAAKKRLKKAAQQLKSTDVHMGVVVLDLTDLFDQEEVAIVAAGPAEMERERLGARLAKISFQLEEQIFKESSGRFVPGYEHIGGYLAFVRGFVWDLNDLRFPDLFHQARFATFSEDAGTTLWWHRAQWLVRMLLNGIEAAGHRISTDPSKPIWS